MFQKPLRGTISGTIIYYNNLKVSGRNGLAVKGVEQRLQLTLPIVGWNYNGYVYSCEWFHGWVSLQARCSM
jgi:hypothetical protein